jgi:hypothetical protein
MEGTFLVGDLGHPNDKTSGLAFAGVHRHMSFAFQSDGYIYDCTGDDGRSFNGDVLDIKYHAMMAEAQ